MISDKHGDEMSHVMYVESSNPSMNRFHSRSPLVKLVSQETAGKLTRKPLCRSAAQAILTFRPAR
jgi:hypothetical protein